MPLNVVDDSVQASEVWEGDEVPFVEFFGNLLEHVQHLRIALVRQVFGFLVSVHMLIIPQDFANLQT